MEDEGLDKFIEEILTTKKLLGLNDEVKAQLISDLKSRLLDQINRALIESLPDDKVDELNNILEKEGVNDDEIQRFIMDSGVDVKRVTIETMLQFRDLYLQTYEERGE